MLETAYSIPTGIMLIPIIGGIVIDKMGVFLFLFFAQLLFVLGFGLGSFILKAADQPANTYVFFTIVQTGYFIIGISYLLLK